MALIGAWYVNVGAFSNDLSTFFAYCALNHKYCQLEFYDNNFDGLALGVDNNWISDSSLTTNLKYQYLGLIFPNEYSLLTFYLSVYF